MITIYYPHKISSTISKPSTVPAPAAHTHNTAVGANVSLSGRTGCFFFNSFTARAFKRRMCLFNASSLPHKVSAHHMICHWNLGNHC